MMETKRYEFLLEAETPIAHHEETFGNSALFMRRKVRQPDGSFATVPAITADTMRHGMREAVAYVFLDAAGLIGNPSLSEAALRLLFAGGMVTGRGDGGAVGLAAYRDMIDLVPSIALFGGCASNRVIPGRLQVEDATLVCEEERRYIPGWVVERMEAEGVGLETGRAHLEEVQRVRMDPTLDPGKRNLLSTGDQALVEGRLLASEKAHVDDDAVARQDTKSSMMPRRFERVARGSLFHWALTATCWTPLDVDTLHTALAAFLYDARVGGKKGTGHGKLRAVAAKNIAVPSHAERVSELDPKSLAPRAGELFRAHVKERGERIRTFLAGVDA